MLNWFNLKELAEDRALHGTEVEKRLANGLLEAMEEIRYLEEQSEETYVEWEEEYRSHQ